MKRLGIFVFFDKDGIVDRYVPFLLQSMLENIDKLIVVCNGFVCSEGLRQLKALASDVYLRDNSGYDVTAFQKALIDYVGWEKLAEYDEVVLWNDTFFGPIYPFKEMFTKMERKKLDFWGMTKVNLEMLSYPHIQSYFMVFAKKVVMHPAFHEYWESLNADAWGYEEVILKHEVKFTKILENFGFTWDTYIQEEEYAGGVKEAGFIKYMFTPYTLVCKHRFPIVKRKAFVYEELERAPYGELLRLMRFLEDSGLYDVNMILENIIRIYNLKILSDVMRWQYCIGERSFYKGNEAVCAKAVVILIIQNSRWIEDIMALATASYFLEIITPKCLEDLVRAKCSENNIQSYELISLPSERSFIKTISQLIEGKQADYVCIIHDFMDDNETDASFIKSKKIANRFENMLGHENTIFNIFNQNKRLAFLIPPPFYYGQDFCKLENNWGQEYGIIERSLRDAGIKVPLDPEIDCVSQEFCFWGRTDITLFTLKILEKLNRQDISWSFFGKIFPYIAQSRGYFTATVCNEDYMQYDSYPATYSLRRLMKNLGNIFGIKDYVSVSLLRVIKYAAQFKNVYIYGAGKIGKRVLTLLRYNEILVNAFLVSDAQDNESTLDGIPVFQFNQSNIPSDACIIIAMRRELQIEIEETIEQSTCKNIYRI